MNIYHQILAGAISFPRYFDRNAKNLIKKLLTADLTKRYGCLKGGAQDIKKHRWFGSTSWSDMFEMLIPAPIVPKVTGDDDTSNFDPYPDSEEEAPIPTFRAGTDSDPFKDF